MKVIKVFAPVAALVLLAAGVLATKLCKMSRYP